VRARLAQTRFGAAVLAVWGVAVGVAPHVLHHVGPFAGAALLAGAGGKLLFGALGFALLIPFLLRLHRRFHTLAAPALATAAFVAIFAVSTLVVSPLITGGSDSQSKTPGVEQPAGHASHHQK
jgi:hypothetical protein